MQERHKHRGSATGAAGLWPKPAKVSHSDHVKWDGGEKSPAEAAQCHLRCRPFPPPTSFLRGHYVETTFRSKYMETRAAQMKQIVTNLGQAGCRAPIFNRHTKVIVGKFHAAA